MTRFLAVALFITCSCMAIFAESADNHTPLPYGEDEFYTWQKDLRRAEIITFGSLPFVTFMSSIYYDIYRYYDHDQDDAYLPWPLKKDNAVPMSEDEQINILKASIGIAIGVAIFDYGFRAIRRAIRKSRIDRANRDMVQPITIDELDEPAIPAVDKDTELESPKAEEAPKAPEAGTQDGEGQGTGLDDGSFRNEPALQDGD